MSDTENIFSDNGKTINQCPKGADVAKLNNALELTSPKTKLVAAYMDQNNQRIKMSNMEEGIELKCSKKPDQVVKEQNKPVNSLQIILPEVTTSKITTRQLFQRLAVL